MDILDPVILGSVGGGVLLLVLLIVVLKKKQQSQSEEDSKPSSHKGTAHQKEKTQASKKKTAEEAVDSEETGDEEAESDDGDWNWSTPAAATAVDDTKVSVQDVDTLTEFNVYKQFGYVDKAAESLAVYLKNHPEKADKRLVGELADLWLEAKKVDELSETLNQYIDLFSTEEITEYIKQGLAVDENHLGLRVLAEARLGWTVKQTEQEIEQSDDSQSAAESSGAKAAENQDEKQKVRYDLVIGEASLSGLSNEEKSTVLAFMEPEKSTKLLRGLMAYEMASRYLNRAIRTAGKPAAYLIDALTLDFKAKNLKNFAEHLWNLYYTLGQGGRQVKERMLGLGYSLGEHPLFGILEANQNDASILRKVGIKLGYIEISAAMKKSRYKNLVNEIVDEDTEPKTPTERILKEAEFLLMYGQLDQSMDMLEQAIKEYPNESQLYITLFDLYERAEEWGRLGELLKTLRTQIQSLPEEVVLAMSQLLQRFNNGSFGR